MAANKKVSLVMLVAAWDQDCSGYCSSTYSNVALEKLLFITSFINATMRLLAVLGNDD